MYKRKYERSKAELEFVLQNHIKVIVVLYASGSLFLRGL